MNKKAVFVFPGQGTQVIGMGADLARDFCVAKEVFEEVDDALHRNLSKLMFSGDIDELTETQNAQPAIMAVSVAAFRVLQKEGVLEPEAVAGHSLGEYSALCAAGILDLSDTAILVQARGKAMSRVCKIEQGGMMVLLGATIKQAQDIAFCSGCYVANDNAPGQVVLSGKLEKLDKAKEMAEKVGIKRVVPLKVMGAFHCPLMQLAADELKPLLEKIHFKTPQIPIYFNVTASVNLDSNKYQNLLLEQIVKPVRWRELIQNTKASCFVECGVGAVLSGLIRRILPGVETLCVGTSENVKNILK